MSAFAPRLERVHRITLAEYQRMVDAGVFADEGTELIGGVIVDVVPLGARRRAILAHLAEALAAAVSEHGRDSAQVSARVGTQQALVLMDNTAFRPDLALLRSNARPAERLCMALDDIALIVEAVEGDAGTVFDLKLPMYAEAGIPEVWVIDTDTAGLTACRQPSSGRYRETMSFAEPGPVAPAMWPQAIVDFAAIFGDQTAHG